MNGKGRWFATLGRSFMAAALMPLLGGCQGTFTYSVLHKESFQPACDPAAKLYDDKKRGDILITYDEQQQPSELGVRRRAFYLNANEERLRLGQKPRFVAARKAARLTAIPLVDGPEDQTVHGGVGSVVVWQEDGQFCIFRNGVIVQSVSLPKYVREFGTTQRVLLTPLAITGDTTAIGLVLGIIFIAHGGAEVFTK